MGTVDKFMSRFRNWCFTINNPESRLTFDEDVVKCCWYQLERGEGGTEHYQGYLELKTPRALTVVKRFVGFSRAHLECRRGTRQQAIDYATKADTRVDGPWTFGDTLVEPTPGKRSDLKEFQVAVKEGMSIADARELYVEVAARYPKFFREEFNQRRIRELPESNFVPREGWQRQLCDRLNEEPSPRKVHWYVDLVGNTGKSTVALGIKEAYIVTGGKHEDIFYAYNFEKTVVFDWPRAKADTFPYAVVESFKNGYFLSTKYECEARRFRVPHVVVFANFEPDRKELSADRWDVHNLR